MNNEHPATRTTQYAIVHKGKVDLALVFGTREAVDAYIANAVEHGHELADYGVAHRVVTFGAWAPTTSWTGR